MKTAITIAAGIAFVIAYLWLASRLGKRLERASEEYPTPVPQVNLSPSGEQQE